ncbi:hypothetical protein AVEN_6753-1 [Araneus ventricosus]|uniref:Uncharacterized protein n=1 Tax=Araneus ventricosus TaxID=182803 RepID=A0A4Y2IC79_ARAVE|nr:hypothetical protein AVEN_6753-1 [Araneus ventricosus]
MRIPANYGVRKNFRCQVFLHFFESKASQENGNMKQSCGTASFGPRNNSSPDRSFGCNIQAVTSQQFSKDFERKSYQPRSLMFLKYLQSEPTRTCSSHSG